MIFLTTHTHAVCLIMGLLARLKETLKVFQHVFMKIVPGVSVKILDKLDPQASARKESVDTSVM